MKVLLLFSLVFVCLWSGVSPTQQGEPKHGIIFNKEGEVSYSLPKYQGPGLTQEVEVSDEVSILASAALGIVITMILGLVWFTWNIGMRPEWRAQQYILRRAQQGTQVGEEERIPDHIQNGNQSVLQPSRGRYGHQPATSQSLGVDLSYQAQSQIYETIQRNRARVLAQQVAAQASAPPESSSDEEEEEEVTCKPELEEEESFVTMETNDDMVEEDDDQTEVDTDVDWTTDEEALWEPKKER